MQRKSLVTFMLWLGILIAVLAIFILLLLFAFVALHVAFGKRCEGNPSLKYFTNADFEGLHAMPVTFASNRGQKLHGAVYTRPEVGEPLGLVVFAHGMGGGHTSYMTEINTFAAAGFAVLAYDNTGTMASEGKSLGSFYQSARDLRAALAFVRSDEVLSRYKIVLAGHSWGGYAVCQTLAYEENAVKGAVAFSAPEGVASVACGSPMLKLLYPFFLMASVVMGGLDARRRSSQILKKTKRVPILLLHGDADRAVTLAASPAGVPAVREKENITVALYEGRAHNVYQTAESEKYLGEVFAAIGAAEKQYGKNNIPPEENERLYAIDYELITREDPEVMKTAIDFMKNCVK